MEKQVTDLTDFVTFTLLITTQSDTLPGYMTTCATKFF